MERAVTLLSGGIDSFLSTALARAEHEVVLALTFDYGQRAAGAEIRAAAKIAKFWRMRHQVVELPWLKNLGENALTHSAQRLPQFRDPQKLSDRKVTERSAEAVWVPNRNGVFINIAAAFAETLGATRILTGFNREEATTFPDNGSDYVYRINRALELSTLMFPPKVKSYVQEMDKAQMVEKLVELDLPVDFFWGCYESGAQSGRGAGAKMCGTCESCARTVAAFKEKKLWDKIEYRFQCSF